MVHVKFSAIVGDLGIVFVILFHEETLVAIGVVGCMRRGCAHILSVTLRLAIALGQLDLSVLIETPERQHDDLVVEEGAEAEENEADDGLPVEWLESKNATHEPDDERTRSVNRSTLRC